MTKEELIENLLAIGFYKATKDIMQNKHDPYGVAEYYTGFEDYYTDVYFYDYPDGQYMLFEFDSTVDGTGEPDLNLYDATDELVTSEAFEPEDYDAIWSYLND